MVIVSGFEKYYFSSLVERKVLLELIEERMVSEEEFIVNLGNFSEDFLMRIEGMGSSWRGYWGFEKVLVGF